MTILALQHVQVNVPALREAEARAFYRDVLGLEEIQRPESLTNAGRSGAWFSLGSDQELHVFFNPGSMDIAHSSAHPALIVDDLAALREYVAAAGCEIEEAIPIEGRERFFTRDPGGNRIEFMAFQ